MNGSLGGTHKRRGSSRSGGVKWDETNLQENEITKAAMQPLIKIREPKTPYHGPTEVESDSESAMQMDPLALDRESDLEVTSSGRSAEHDDEVDSRDKSAESHGDFRCDHQATSAERHAGVGWSDGDTDDPEEAEAAAHKRFLELRKKHYQLPTAKVLTHENGVDENGIVENGVEENGWHD